MNALVGQLGPVRYAKQIHHHAGRVQSERLFDRLLDHPTEQRPRQRGAVHVRHVGAQHEGRFFTARQRLEVVRLADGELDGVGSGGDHCLQGFFEVFDAVQKAAFVEKAVVDSDVKAVARSGVEHAVEAIAFHESAGRIPNKNEALVKPQARRVVS